MISLEFHPEAVAELIGIAKQYERVSEKLAERFWKQFNAAVVRLKTFPDSHPKVSRNYRWVRLRRFPYVIYFRGIEGDSDMVVAFTHQARRRYWLNRD